MLVPLVYGCIHLGKKVLDQSHVINTQNEVIVAQQSAISTLQQQQQNGSDGSSSSSSSSSGIARVTAATTVVAASVLAFNIGRALWNQSTSQSSSSSSPKRPGPHYEPSKASSEEDECRICCDNRRDTILDPCRHFALCWPCASKIHSTLPQPQQQQQQGSTSSAAENRCPICRAEIKELQFVYVSC